MNGLEKGRLVKSVTCSCPGSTSGCHTFSLCRQEKDETQMLWQFPKSLLALLASDMPGSYVWCPDKHAVWLHLWKTQRVIWRRFISIIIFHYHRHKTCNNTSKTMEAWATAVLTDLWLMICVRPLVFRCRKISGMTSARLSTHSRQCVFNIPCSFGSK